MKIQMKVRPKVQIYMPAACTRGTVAEYEDCAAGGHVRCRKQEEEWAAEDAALKAAEIQ